MVRRHSCRWASDALTNGRRASGEGLPGSYFLLRCAALVQSKVRYGTVTRFFQPLTLRPNRYKKGTYQAAPVAVVIVVRCTPVANGARNRSTQYTVLRDGSKVCCCFQSITSLSVQAKRTADVFVSIRSTRVAGGGGGGSSHDPSTTSHHRAPLNRSRRPRRGLCPVAES